MKAVFAILVSMFVHHQSSYASGCDWDQFGIELKAAMSFLTSGEIVCKKGEACTLKISPSGIVLKGPVRNADSSTHKNHLNASIKIYQEYGSCYSDGELVVWEVTVDGDVFSSELSYNSPYYP